LAAAGLSGLVRAQRRAVSGLRWLLKSPPRHAPAAAVGLAGKPRQSLPLWPVLPKLLEKQANARCGKFWVRRNGMARIVNFTCLENHRLNAMNTNKIRSRPALSRLGIWKNAKSPLYLPPFLRENIPP